MSEQSCLTCRWLSEPENVHKWHTCLWLSGRKMPDSIIGIQTTPVNVDVPFTDCPTWEKRHAPKRTVHTEDGPVLIDDPEAR